MYCPKDKPVAFGGGGYYLKSDNHYSTAGEMHSNTVTETRTIEIKNKDGVVIDRYPTTGWRYKSFSHSPTDKLVVSTPCAPLPPGSTVPDVQDNKGITTPFGSSGTQQFAFAQCPAGETSLSGGFESLADVYSSWQGDTNWQVVAAGNGIPLIVRAQCIPNSPF